MHKLVYLIQSSMKRALRRLNTNKTLFLSFYMGLFLPLIGLGNVSYLDADYNTLQFEGMEHSQRISWSSKLLTKQERGSLAYSLNAEQLEFQMLHRIRAAELNNAMIPIAASSEFGQLNDEKQKLCYIGTNLAKRYALSVGETINIDGTIYKISEIIYSGSNIENVVVAMNDIVELVKRDEIIQQTMIVERSSVEEAYEQTKIMGWFQEHHILIDYFEVMNAGDYYQMGADAAKSWMIARVAVSVCGGLFALVNITVILVGKMREQKKTYGIMLALGGKHFDLSISFLIENLIIALLADALLLLTFPYVLKITGMDQMIMIDAKAIFGLLAATLVMVLSINVILVYYLIKMPITESIQGEY